ncbi:MAG: gas vesicle structural protein GvpA [Actinomycetota bacterium]|nr:gas vesicle structural protein GvpA [Actinomycetota bacterium]
MTVATQSVNRAPRPSSLADVLEVVLDKGIVIDAYVRVAVVGIELLTIDARIVIASVDTYLRFAEAVNRLDLNPDGQVSGLPGMMEEITEGGASSKTKGALSGAADKARDAVSSLTGDEEEEEQERPRRRPAKKTASKRTSSSRSSGTRRRRQES